MIIIKLIGGLGNQMFQYALGRNLSIRNKIEFKMDLSGFNVKGDFTPRHYELMVFPIKEKFAAPEEVAKLKGIIKSGFFTKISNLIKRILMLVFKGMRRVSPDIYDVFDKKISSILSKIPITRNNFFLSLIFTHISTRSIFYHQKHIIERQVNFEPDIFKIHWPVYLEGFWASEKYFKDIEEIIRQDFSFRDLLEGKNFEVAQEINRTNSVSIHVRRGDYVTLPSATNLHGNICDLAYYDKAIKIIASKIENPHFFVFSDDIPWVQENLAINYHKTYVNFNNGDKSFRDMHLMSLCKHNIIANSSFSWWGAWLNRNRDKIVIAPKKWYNDPKKNIKDILPENWIKI